MNTVWWWLLHLVGIDDPAGRWYLLWSGLASDLSELTLLGALIGLYWRHACHVRGCWRIGRHPVEGTGFTVCRRHHPEGGSTHEHILRLHRRARERSTVAPPSGEGPI